MHCFVLCSDWIYLVVQQHVLGNMSWRWKMKFTNLMAKALYDNKAETPDELAFRKGDILTVIEQNIKGDEGWWRCSLHGRQGIVPGNRLQLLTGSQYDIPSLYPSPCWTLRRTSQQNIYQMPTIQHQGSPSPSLSGQGNNVYQVPSRPQSYGQYYQVPVSSAEYCWDRGQAPPRQVFTLPRMGHAFSLNSMSGPFADAYDIPSSHVPRTQGSQMSGSPAAARKYSMFQTEGERKLIQQLYDIPLSFERPRAATDSQVYDVPPRVSPDGAPSAYPVPGSVGREMPGVRRPPWDGQEERRGQRQAVYDVPVSREEAAGPRAPSRAQWPDSGQALYDVPTPQGGRLYDIPPARAAPDIYDVPASQPKPAAAPCGPQAIYDLPRGVPPDRKGPASAEPVYDIPPPVSRPPQSGQGSERRQSAVAEAPATPQGPAASPATPQRPATFPATLQGPATPQRPAASPATPQRPATFPVTLQGPATPQGPAASPATPQGPANSPATPQGPVNSPAPSPAPASPPAEELALGAEEAASALTRLQQQVSASVASLMVFVSSRWRLRDHLQQHLGQVQAAAVGVLGSLGAFLGFVRGVRVNAGRLTDANLQGRLLKQLEVVEDSHRALLDTGRELAACGWALDLLVVTAPLAAPDHLDRFVMVTRTVPDDVKRLVSIIIANGKLLFPQCPQRQQEEEFERQEKEKESIRQREKESFKQKKLLLERQMSEAKIRRPGDVSVKASPEVIQSSTSSSESYKTYFNALQKAIVSFTDTINGNQPADALIKHSKVVIMIGQKLVDTLCQETGQKNIHKEVLSRSNQFCGRMKKVAVATKNAVMQPNPTTVQEMKEQVAELRQQADQLRLLLEQNATL
ncbi:LOW QUALITY PROTEIN: enhancer of filamentation 1 [Pristis pectinata]|uniref:LOW QUALITY PROTEIN: enhancer of filamentation 1 n=1 Tax=Pristis pectinata TaxID=685728 RepID=UPI00223D5668|nr:LOW QUALITY PROTEIN: enhancer of filamentation 1 [Pristis pectinata]